MTRLFHALLLGALALATSAAGAQTARVPGRPTPVPHAPLRGGGELIGDPSFETGTPNAAWAEASTTFGTPLCSAACVGPDDYTAHTGAWWVWFGGTDDAETGSVSQTITIPSNATELRFWLRIPFTAGLPLGSGSLVVAVDGAPLATYTEDDSLAYATWTEVALPVTAFADDATHLLSFTETNAAGAIVNFFVDDVTMAGTITGPNLTIQPVTIDFGDVSPGTSTPPTPVTLSNRGTAPVTIQSITGSGAPFVVSLAGTDLTLAGGESTTFTVQFAPTAAGTASGAVTLTSNAPGSPATVALRGAGVNPSSYSGTTAGGPTWTRPSNVGSGTGTSGSCTLSPVGVGVAYDAVPFTVGAAGSFGFRADWTGGQDGFLLVYRAPFNPADPCLGLLALNDDGPGGGNSTIEGLSLAPGTDYVLVATNFDPTDSGTYAVTATGPGAVTFVTTATDAPSRALATLSVAPNPARGVARVRLATPLAQHVRVVVYDVTGRQVAVLFTGVVAVGRAAEFAFDTAGLPPGAYVVRALGAQVDAAQRVTVVP